MITVINFTRAFDSAWERMMIILFRPFDLGKWCVIGFSAFLAGLISGGNGISGSSYNGNPNFYQTDNTYGHVQAWPQIHTAISNFLSGFTLGLIVLAALVIFALIIAVVLVIYWLSARGQFLFLDNIVRNRAAISWPWNHYARQANSLFWFYLLVMVFSFAVILPILAVAIVMAIPYYVQLRWPVGQELTGFVFIGLVYFIVVTVLSLILFIFREFGVPLMFRNGLMARTAFVESLGIIRDHFGSVVVFVLLRFAIFIGVSILSVIACCLTCCFEALPYVGTVILLPMLVYVRCFSLDCLAQFGPQFDAWTVDVPPAPENPAAPTPITPPPPLG